MWCGVAIANAIAVLMGCALGAGNAVAADDGCARAAAVPDDATRSQAVDSVLCLVNGERATHGLAPVHASAQLTRSAQAHSQDMVARDYFSHVTPGGKSVRRRVVSAGYPVSRRQPIKVGETIAWGTNRLGTPAQLVRSFMSSPGHRQILLDRSFRDVGVGLVLGAPVAGMPGAGATLTLDFGRRG
jgi:uncharacterized protein YkwD